MNHLLQKAESYELSLAPGWFQRSTFTRNMCGSTSCMLCIQVASWWPRAGRAQRNPLPQVTPCWWRTLRSRDASRLRINEFDIPTTAQTQLLVLGKIWVLKNSQACMIIQIIVVHNGCGMLWLKACTFPVIQKMKRTSWTSQLPFFGSTWLVVNRNCVHCPGQLPLVGTPWARRPTWKGWMRAAQTSWMLMALVQSEEDP